MAANTDLARSIYEAWNNRDFDYLADLTASDGTLTNPGTGQTLYGPDGARQYNTAWYEAFPDGRITVDRVIADGDCVVVEFTGRGTHTGTMAMPGAGSIPPTGKSATLHFCDVLEFADGKVTSQVSYFDSGSLMAQLGLTAAAETATQQ